MDIADWIILAILLFSAWEGYRTGFVRQLVRLSGTLVAYVAAWQLSPFVSPYLDTWVTQVLLKNIHSASAIPIVGMLSTGSNVAAVAKAIAGALAFGLVFFVALLLVRYLGHLLNAVFSLPLLSWINRLLGLAAGVVVAFLILAVLIDVGTYLPASAVKTQIRQSALAPMFTQPVQELARMEGIALPVTHS